MSSTKATETKRTLREQEAEQHAAQAKAKAGEATAAAGESAREATQVRDGCWVLGGWGREEGVEGSGSRC